MSRGHNRERDVRDLLMDQDWWVARAAGSLGDADLVALRDGDRPMLLEVKSTAGGPYEKFGPSKRAALLQAGFIAGADVWLIWWPPAQGRKTKPKWIHPSEFPKPRQAT